MPFFSLVCNSGRGRERGTPLDLFASLSKVDDGQGRREQSATLRVSLQLSTLPFIFMSLLLFFLKSTDCQVTVFIPESCSQCVKVIVCNAVKAESIPLANWCVFTWSRSCLKFVSVNWGWGEPVRVILRYTVKVRQISDCSWVRDARNTSLHLGRVHPRC